uniref:Laminin G domain-containing protein n=1 Tax=Lutzomyia longipalpis TaxID=7200 RepID=A0A1B0GJ83_LUTLO
MGCFPAPRELQLDFSAQLEGNGFIELDYFTVGPNSSVQHETALAIIFSTTAPNGLLLWHGQKSTAAVPRGDFVALAANGGYLEFVFRSTAKRRVSRAANQGSLELDNYIDYGETRASSRSMHLPGHIHIGGIPKASNLTGGRYRESFNGCIHVVQDITRGPINFGVFAVNAENVHSCAHPSWTSSSLVFSEVENLLNGALVHIIYPRPAINNNGVPMLISHITLILAMLTIAMGTPT